MGKGQFTYRSKNGKEYDFTPHMEFRDGAYESPGKAFPRIIEDKFPQLKDEYNEHIEKRKAAMSRLDKLIRR